VQGRRDAPAGLLAGMAAAQGGGWSVVARRKDRSGGWGCQCGAEGNWMTRTSCRQCGRRAPTKVVAQAAAGAAKAAEAVSATGGATGQVTETKKERSLREELVKLRKECAKLRQSATAEPKAPQSGGVDADDDRIAKLKEEIAKLEGLEDCGKLIEGRKAEIEQLQKKKAASRPIHQQLRDAQGRLERRQKALDKKLEEDIPAKRREMASAQERLTEALDEAEKIKEEVKQLQEEVRRVSDLPNDKDGRDKVGQRATEWSRVVPMFDYLLTQVSNAEQQEVLGKMKDLLTSLSDEDIAKAEALQAAKEKEASGGTAPGEADAAGDGQQGKGTVRQPDGDWIEEAFDLSEMGELDDAAKEVISKMKARALGKKQKCG